MCPARRSMSGFRTVNLSIAGSYYVTMRHRLLVALLAVALIALRGTAAPVTTPPPQSPLYVEVANADAALFAAYNAHDVAKVMSYFSEDLEFYHDKDGLVTYAQVHEGFKRLLASGDIRRELIPGSMHVYPLPGIGAIETGAHRFCHTENGKDDCGVFEFAMIWQKKDDRWRITRVISYGH